MYKICPYIYIKHFSREITALEKNIKKLAEVAVIGNGQLKLLSLKSERRKIYTNIII